MFEQQQNLGQRLWASKIHLNSCDLGCFNYMGRFMFCFHYLCFCVWSLFFYAVISVLSSFAIILLRKREFTLIVFHYLCFCVWSLLFYAVISVLSSFAIILLRKREFTLIVFLLSFGCLCSVSLPRSAVLGWSAVSM